MRSNKRKDTKLRHIVSVWSQEDGYCLGQKAVDEKSNEVTAITKVLESIEIKGLPRVQLVLDYRSAL